MGFSLFDFYGPKLSVETVYNGFGGLWFMVHIPATAVPGKYQWGCLPLSRSNMSTQYLVTQAPPYHCNISALKETSGSHLGPAPTTLKSALETSTDIHIVHIRPVIQAVPTWNLPGEGFSKYSLQVGTASP